MFPFNYLVSKQNFRQKIKLRLGRFKKYLEEGLIKPVGKGIVNTSAGIANFYHPKQIKEFEALIKVLETCGIFTFPIVKRDLSLKILI